MADDSSRSPASSSHSASLRQQQQQQQQQHQQQQQQQQPRTSAATSPSSPPSDSYLQPPGSNSSSSPTSAAPAGPASSAVPYPPSVANNYPLGANPHRLQNQSNPYQHQQQSLLQRKVSVSTHNSGNADHRATHISIDSGYETINSVFPSNSTQYGSYQGGFGNPNVGGPNQIVGMSGNFQQPPPPQAIMIPGDQDGFYQPPPRAPVRQASGSFTDQQQQQQQLQFQSAMHARMMPRPVHKMPSGQNLNAGQMHRQFQYADYMQQTGTSSNSSVASPYPPGPTGPPGPHGPRSYGPNGTSQQFESSSIRSRNGDVAPPLSPSMASAGFFDANQAQLQLQQQQSESFYNMMKSRGHGASSLRNVGNGDNDSLNSSYPSFPSNVQSAPNGQVTPTGDFNGKPPLEVQDYPFFSRGDSSFDMQRVVQSLPSNPASSVTASGNSTHPLIFHAPNDPIPALLANRPVVEISILLGARGHRAPSLLAQLQAQPPHEHSTLRLVGSASNRYAGVGEYWDATPTKVIIEGNVPLGKSVKRLRNAVTRSEKVREHVVKNDDISMAMMGWMTATCEDLCSSTEEMRVDFEGEGGIVGILATCHTWIYHGSDGASATPADFEPIWEKQFTVSSRVAHVRLELVEPITDFVTPFASAMCARSRARDGDPAAGMMTLLTYEARHGGPKVAHWIVLRSWGCGSGALRAGDSLDSSWIAADATTRGAPSHVLSTVSTSVPMTLDLSLLPDTTASLSWSLFCRVIPPLQVSHVHGTTGVQLNPGEYHVLGGVQTGYTVQTQMEALQRVIGSVGSKTALAACGYPHMPDGISPSAFRDLCQFSTKRSRIAFTALGGIMMTRGKKEAIRSLLSAVSLVGRMGDRIEKQEVLTRACEGGYLVHSVSVQEAVVQFANAGQTLSWLCLSGGKIRMVLVCSGARGNVRCLGTATFVGVPVGPPDGVGVLIS